MTSLSGIPLEIVPNAAFGMRSVQEILYDIVDSETVLFLSGGKTPRDLYASLAKEQKLHPGAVALVDERYGKVFHALSNERMIRETGLLDYFSASNIAAHRVIKENVSMNRAALEYEKTLIRLFNNFSKRVAILGIGLDGHTAGLPASKLLWEKQVSERAGSLVTYYDDSNGVYKKRISMTFKALEQMTRLFVLVFGKDKKPALLLTAQDGDEEDAPARFFKRHAVAQKTLLITDQKV